MFKPPRSKPQDIPLPEDIRKEIDKKVNKYSYQTSPINPASIAFCYEWADGVKAYRQALENTARNKIRDPESYNIEPRGCHV